MMTRFAATWCARVRGLIPVGLQTSRHFTTMIVATYGATALQLIRGLVLARQLGPEDFGVLTLVALVAAWGAYSDIGVTAAMSREIPVGLAAGDRERIVRVHSTSVWFRLLSGSVVAGGCLAYAGVAGHESTETRLAIAAAGLLVLLQGLSSTQVQVLQASQLFPRAAALTILLPFLTLVLSAAGAALLGLVGCLAGQLLANIALTAASIKAVPPSRVKPDEVRTDLVELIRSGIPLAILAFVGYNLINIDQTVIVWLLDTKALGVYALVLYAGSVLYLLPTAVARVMGPKILHRYEECGRNVKGIEDLTWRPVWLLSIMLPPAIALGWAACDVVIPLLLPEYAEAATPMRIYLTGMYFLCLNLGVSNSLIALNRHRWNIPILVGVIGLNILIDYMLVSVLGLGLAGIALGSLIAYATYWLLHSGLVRWFFEQSYSRVILQNGMVGWPGLALIGVMFLSQMAIAHSVSIVLVDSIGIMAAVLVGAVQMRFMERRCFYSAGADPRPA